MLWEELLVLSRFHFVITSGQVEFLSPASALLMISEESETALKDDVQETDLILETDLIVASSDKLPSRDAIKQEFKNVDNYSRFKKKTTFSGQNIIIQEQCHSPSHNFRIQKS